MSHVKNKAPRSVLRHILGEGAPAQEIKKNDTETLFVMKIVLDCLLLASFYNLSLPISSNLFTFM